MSKLPITIAGNAPRGGQQVSFFVSGWRGGRQHSRFRNIQHYTDTNQKFFERVRALNLWAVNNSVSIRIVECRLAATDISLCALLHSGSVSVGNVFESRTHENVNFIRNPLRFTTRGFGENSFFIVIN